MTSTPDAIVIGAGPNGLVAANALADAGWDVVLVEAGDRTGGAVRSEEVTASGFVTDMFSAFYPLAAASPVIRGLHLEQHGLVWAHAPAVLAHALDDGRAALLSRNPEVTAASVEAFGAGDGDAWLALFAEWQRVRDPIVDALFSPLPPVRAVGRVLRRLGPGGSLDLARLGVLPVRRLARERFGGVGAELLLVGNAMHSDVPPDAAGSGVFGWLLAMLGQDVGFPVPQHGAGALAEALTRRAQAGGVEGVHGRPGDRRRDRRRAGRGSPARGRDTDPGRAGRARRRRRPGPVPGPRRSGPVAPAAAPRPRPVPVRPPDDQGQLGARPPSAVGGERRGGRRNRAPGRGRRRLRRHGGRPVRGAGARAPLRALRSDDDLRPDPVTGRHGVRVGIHTRTGRPRLDGRTARPPRRPGRAGRRTRRAGLPADPDSPACAVPRRPGTSRRQPRRRGDQRRDRGRPPRARLPADAGTRQTRDPDPRPVPRRRVRAPRGRRARRLRLECRAQRVVQRHGVGAVRRRLVHTAWDRILTPT